MAITGTPSLFPVMEISTPVEWGWRWNSYSAGMLTLERVYRKNYMRVYKRDAASATAIIYATSASVGSGYYLENRDCRLKSGMAIYTCVETWRNEGAWATGIPS